MENGEFKVEIPISINGSKATGSSSQKGSKYEQEIVKQQKNMTSNLGGILKATVVVATIWTALSPILTPLIKLLSLLALVVFMPLLPYIKKMSEKLGEMIKQVRSGQTGAAAGGEFAGGLGVLFGDMSVVGAAIAAAFLLALTGGSALGALALAVSALITWELITGASDIEDALIAAGLAFLAGSLASLMMGAGTASLSIGLLAAELTLGFSLIGKAMKEEDWRVAALEGLGGSLLVGAVASKIVGGVLAAMGIGAGSLTIPLAALTFVMFAEWKWGIFDKAGDFINGQLANLKEIPARLGTGEYSIIESIFGKKERYDDIVYDFNLGIAGTRAEIERLQTEGTTNMTILKNQTQILSDSVGNETLTTSLKSNLMNTSNEFTNMSDIANTSINSIIENIARIPDKKVTIHEIRTVRTNG